MYSQKREKQAGSWSSVKTVLEIPVAHIQVNSSGSFISPAKL